MSRLGSAGLAAFAALAATVLIGLATAPRATAAPGVKYGLTDDAWLLNGSGTLESRLARLDALGVRITRFTLHWDEIAASRPDSSTDPSDPAYDWAADDAVLDGLREHGIEVVLQLVGTPDWANGGLPAELRAHLCGDVRCICDSRGPQISVGAPLVDLERAEPGPVASSHDAGGLHLATSQSRLHRDPQRDRRCPGRRRRNGSARLDRRCLAGHLAARHAQGPRESSTPTRTTRTRSTRSARPHSAAAARSARRSRWRRSTGWSAS